MPIEFFNEDGTPSATARVVRLPGGEWHSVATAPLTGSQLAFVRDASADDLLCLAIWADAVHRDGGSPAAAIPYLPGARQDRRRPGEALSAAIYADLINRCMLRRVVCLDPHSDVMPALLDHCVTVAASEALHAAPCVVPWDFTGIIIPDAGAVKRANAVADRLSIPTFQALKRRDPATGTLSGFTCEPLPATGRFLVVDDICDGGGTFKGLASATGVPRERLSLWVSHGIFSGAAAGLAEHYRAIYTTNSRSIASHMPQGLVRTVDVRPLLLASLL